MSESTQARVPAPPKTESAPPERARSAGLMPALGPSAVGARPGAGDDPSDLGPRARWLGVQRRAGNRAVGALLARHRSERPLARAGELDVMFHEASRTGSRATATRAAARAVRGARRGGLPHADRITAVTGGKVDGRSFAGAAVEGLPALGVTYGGRIAVREGAPFSVTAHEVAHALGADERTADRVERDPRLLGQLDRRAPVNGWKIGFEFQCRGDDQPIVFKSEWSSILERSSYKKNSGKVTLERRDGYKLTADSSDLEIVTEPFSEDDEGVRRLEAVFGDIEGYLTELNDGERVADRAERQRLETPKLRGKARAPKFSSYVLAMPGKTITASPQATLGVKTGAVSELIRWLLLNEKNHYYGWGGRSRMLKGEYKGDGVDTGSLSTAQQCVKACLEGAVAGHRDVSLGDLPNLRALLELLASYSMAARMMKKTKHLKNIAPFMLRNSGLDIYNAMSDTEKQIMAEMQAEAKLRGGDRNKSMVGVFYVADAATYAALKLVPGGVSEPDDGYGDIDPNTLLVTEVIDGFLGGRDLIGEVTGEVSIHRLELGELEGAESTTDIGGDRSGVFVELRRLREKLPLEDWGNMAWALQMQAKRLNRD